MPGRLIGAVTRALGRHRLLRLLSLYPPYLGAGIRVTGISPDLTRVDVAMPLTRLNRNYVGTQFGGSLYSMCDPFFMLILIENLGRDFIVWDKAASIRFLKPGRGTVRARFEIPAARIEEIRQAAMTHKKVEPEFTVQIRDETGEVIAEVEKRLYVRRKT
jgi:acyl-coenzyme A thioesterase PaaI-like protein